jgi:hypothetical protein
VNAAFLLVTSAMLVGQAGDKKPVTPPPAMAPVASSCGSSCECEGFGHRFRDRLRGFFNRDTCDSCQPACHTHTHTPLFRSSCESACRPKIWTWERPCHEACAPACHTHTHACASGCSDPCERSLLARLRERLQRDRCCDSGCASGGCASGGCAGTTVGTSPVPVMKEKVDPPAKKLPVEGPKEKEKAKKVVGEEVRVEPAPVPFAVPVSPTAPSVEIIPVPTPAPRVEGARRDPF